MYLLTYSDVRILMRSSEFCCACTQHTNEPGMTGATSDGLHVAMHSQLPPFLVVCKLMSEFLKESCTMCIVQWVVRVAVMCRRSFCATPVTVCHSAVNTMATVSSRQAIAHSVNTADIRSVWRLAWLAEVTCTRHWVTSGSTVCDCWHWYLFRSNNTCQGF